ncbi:hypothetical protein KGA66_04860 [Actinocrinis puniceicyclus]|uniref:HTH luxR-type domain-containing protein n=1 Tax=Actinocrinis puniceicyclus TaxID=977794 RepID=A0A8J7WHR0_9ACTN|nr:LuxR family transcriptional regulator [Actinocrinis puniceicyclus]MBS2962366.1 hypothetical protein [Actinocrinis puniceicyclus]
MPTGTSLTCPPAGRARNADPPTKGPRRRDEPARARSAGRPAAYSAAGAAADCLEGAARQAINQMPELAVRLALRALDLTEPDDPGRGRRIVTAIEAHLAAGNLARAIELAEETSVPREGRDGGDLQQVLAHALLVNGRHAEAAVAARRVLDNPAASAAARAQTQAVRLLALRYTDPALGRAEAERWLVRGGHPAATAGCVLAELAWQRGAVEEALKLSRDAVRRIGERTVSVWSTHAQLVCAYVTAVAGDTDSALSAVLVLVQRAAAVRTTFVPELRSVPPMVTQAQLLLRIGQPREAAGVARRAVAASRGMQARLHSEPATCVLAAALLRTGDLDGAAECLERDRFDGVPPAGAFWRRYRSWINVQLTAARFGAERAARLLTGPDRALLTSAALAVDEPGAPGWMTRTLLATGHGDQAAAVAEHIERLAREHPRAAVLRAAALHVRGLIRQDAAMLESACAEHLTPWARALATEDLAGCRTLEAQRARRRLAEARELFERGGAVLDAGRLARRLGEPGQPRPGRAQPAPGPWERLSDIERTVAVLVSEGLTNGQVARRISLSPHTVNYHMRGIFKKLGIRSRAQLAGLAREHEPRGANQPQVRGDDASTVRAPRGQVLSAGR